MINFLFRRYKEDKSKAFLASIIGSLFIFFVCLFKSYEFFKSGTLWTLMPVLGVINSALIIYGLSSYKKPSYMEKGHTTYQDFYNMLNPSKKIPHAVEFIFGGIMGTNIMTIGGMMTLFSLTTIMPANEFLSLNRGFVLFGLFSLFFLFTVRLNYISKINEQMVTDHEVINFLKTFKNGESLFAEYKEMLSNDRNLHIYEHHFKKSKFLERIKKLEEENKIADKLIKLKENIG